MSQNAKNKKTNVPETNILSNNSFCFKNSGQILTVLVMLQMLVHIFNRVN